MWRIICPARLGSVGWTTNRWSDLNPLLVYCAIPPFGEEGPLADKPANDGVIAAYSGLMGNQNGPKGMPEYSTVPGPELRDGLPRGLRNYFGALRARD